MATAPVPAPPPTGRERTRPAWLYAAPMWAGVTSVAIWVAVLFVGLFAGDIVSINGPAGTTTTIPSVVVVALFALLATVGVARRGFGPRNRDGGAS
jgi:hypothetical protein